MKLRDLSPEFACRLDVLDGIHYGFLRSRFQAHSSSKLRGGVALAIVALDEPCDGRNACSGASPRSSRLRKVRRWEAGDNPIPGPAQVAVEMMLARAAAPAEER